MSSTSLPPPPASGPLPGGGMLPGVEVAGAEASGSESDGGVLEELSRVAGRLEHLASGVLRVLDAIPDGLPAADSSGDASPAPILERLDACFAQVKGCEGALAATKARLVSLAGSAKAAQDAGMSDTGAYLRDRLGVSGPEAKRQTELARSLESMDGAAEALADGRLGPEQASVLGQALQRGRLGGGEQVQQDLLEVATTSTPEQLRRTVREREQEADADALRQDENRAHALRRATLSKQAGGMWLLRAELDPANGETVHAALRAFERPDPTGTPPEHRRSPEQRRADALVDTADAALRGEGAGTSGGSRPQISVVIQGHVEAVGHDPTAASSGEDDSPGRNGAPNRCRCFVGSGDLGGQVLEGPGSPLVEAGQLVEGAGSGAVEMGLVLDGGGVTGSGTVLSTAATSRFLCDATLSRVVLGAPGQVLDVGRAKRAWNPAQRRAIVVRDGHCRGPGCDRPPDWCDVHHIRWWHRGGRTDLRNGLLLCRFHHRLVHEGGWGLRYEADTGRAVFIDRRGRERATLPRGSPVG